MKKLLLVFLLTSCEKDYNDPLIHPSTATAQSNLRQEKLLENQNKILERIAIALENDRTNRIIK